MVATPRAPQRRHEVRRPALPAQRPEVLAHRLRDGVLQDVVALGMLTQALRDRLQGGDETDPQVAMLVERIGETLGEDAERLRDLIAQLESA